MRIGAAKEKIKYRINQLAIMSGTMSGSMDDQITEQCRHLETMPLTEEELAALSRVRRRMATYGTAFGTAGTFGGLSIVGPSAPWSTRAPSAIAFGLIGAFIGVAYGLQRGLIALEAAGGALGEELARLNALKAEMRRAGANVDPVEAELQGIFNRRTERRKEK